MYCLKCEHELEERVTSLPAEVKGEAVTVEGMVALVCPACGYATVRGSDMPEYMRRAADVFRQHQGLLTSDEIRSRRQALHMTQEEFANHLSVGIASIKRWELGQVQEKAMDSLIRVRTSRAEAQENLCRLSELFRNEPTWCNFVAPKRAQQWTAHEVLSVDEANTQFAYAA